MKIKFPDFKENNGEVEFKSLRNTSSQALENNGRFNKRKLNEFISLLEKLKDKNLCLEMMKEHLYHRSDEQSFFNIFQKYFFNKHPYSGEIFSANNNLNLVLASSYFNHLDWLQGTLVYLNEKNQRGETSCHLGIKTVL